MKTITIKMLQSYVKKRLKKKLHLNMLGFLENQDLDSEVEQLFVVGNGIGWDWVNGNDKFKILVENIKKGTIKWKARYYLN